MQLCVGIREIWIIENKESEFWNRPIISSITLAEIKICTSCLNYYLSHSNATVKYFIKERIDRNIKNLWYSDNYVR